MVRDLNLEAVNGSLSREVQKLHAELKAADAETATLRAKNERLRAALEPLACTCDRPNGAACSRREVDCPFWNARAALEEHP